MTATRGRASTTTERVIDRVHRHATHLRPLAETAAASGLAAGDVLVVDVADLADRRHALDVDLANLARGHLDRRVLALARHQLHPRSRAARDLPALARPQLDVVNGRAQRDVLERQAIARQDVDAVAGQHRVADLHAI